MEYTYGIGVHYRDEDGDQQFAELKQISYQNPISPGHTISAYAGGDEFTVIEVMHDPNGSFLHVKPAGDGEWSPDEDLLV